VAKNCAVLFALALCAGGVARADAPLTASATPNALKFIYQLGSSTLPAAQSVSLRASAGTPAYSITTADPWVIATPSTGSLPAQVSVLINPSSLPSGTYTSVVNVQVAGIVPPVQVAITLVITFANGGLTLNPATVSLTAPPLQQTATVEGSAENEPVSFTAASGNTWLTVSPTVGVAIPGAPVTFTLSVNASTLSPSATPYSGKITIVTSGTGTTTKSQVLTVAVTVNSSAPTIASIWPPVIPVGSGNTELTITGTNFYTGTTVSVTGLSTSPKATVLDSTHLNVTLPANLLQAPSTLTITLTNPAPGGSVSASEPVSNAPIVGSVGNAASYDSTAIAPGELIAIFGVNMGPMPPLTMTETANPGFADTTLGGVTVQIEGLAAPLLYVSNTQINAQVPYEVTQGNNQSVVVSYGSNTATWPVTVAAADPGLFSADGSGMGAVAAVNEHTVGGVVQWSLNTASSPAYAGDVVELYLTGEGDWVDRTIIPEPTGFIVPYDLTPLPQDKPYPVVTIGGLQATVEFAGPAAGCIMGLLQIDVQVPAVITAGAAGISVAFGTAPNPTFTTPAGTTLYVHP